MNFSQAFGYKIVYKILRSEQNININSKVAMQIAVKCLKELRKNGWVNEKNPSSLRSIIQEQGKILNELYSKLDMWESLVSYLTNVWKAIQIRKEIDQYFNLKESKFGQIAKREILKNLIKKNILETK